MKRSSFALCAILLACLSGMAWPQSVADAAAASRANKKSTSKTITNDDAKPSDTTDSQEADEESGSRSSADKHESRATQITNQVQRLKQRIAVTQSRLDQLNQQKTARESRFSDYDETAREQYYARFRQAEQRSQNAITSAQQQLDQLKTKLSDLQEQARKEGFGNSVYEPD